jgi:hypothetical protein
LFDRFKTVGKVMTIRGHVFCSFHALVLKAALEDRIAAVSESRSATISGQEPERPSPTYLIEHDIRMPVRLRGGAGKGELEWRRVSRPTL